MKKILLLCVIFLACQQQKIVIDNTKDYIAFHRIPDIEPIWDYNIWLTNTQTGEEMQITDNLEYWEHLPVWLSSSELLYLFEKPTPSAVKIVYLNFNTGKRKYLNFWTWRNEPGIDKIGIGSLSNIYYSINK